MNSDFGIYVVLFDIAVGVIAYNVAKAKNRTINWSVLCGLVFPPALLILLLLPSLPPRTAAAAPQAPAPALRTVTVIERQRGFFGRLIAVVFWLFHAFMVAWAATYLFSLGDLMDGRNDNYVAFGGLLGMSMLLWIWLFGSIITGLLMLATRGHKVARALVVTA